MRVYRHQALSLTLRDYAIAIAAILVSVSFAVCAFQDVLSQYNLEKSRSICGKDKDNAGNIENYSKCMRYRGFENDLKY